MLTTIYARESQVSSDGKTIRRYPVIVPSSGKAIEAHFLYGDPVSKDVASVSDLIANRGTRDAVASYRKQASQASQWWQ